MIRGAELERLTNLYRLSNLEELQRLAGYASEVPADQEIVEIGSWAGGSAAWLCVGAKRAHITCIDIWLDWRDPPPDEPIVMGEDARQRFTEVVDWTKLTALKGSSEQVGAMWMKPIGLLFIDDGHSWAEIDRDYRSWAEFVAPGGVLAVHDYIPDWDQATWWAEDPTRYVDEVIATDERWEPLGATEWTWFARRR
jgi:choline dehydrogenase-like flavoprotein